MFVLLISTGPCCDTASNSLETALADWAGSTLWLLIDPNVLQVVATRFVFRARPPESMFAARGGGRVARKYITGVSSGGVGALVQHRFLQYVARAL